MICKNCNTPNNDTDKFCVNCGQPLQAEQPWQGTNMRPESTAGQEDKPSGMAIASMVLGIVSIPMCCTIVISLACGIIAIVFAKQEERKGCYHTFTKVGFICGIIGASLGLLYLCYVIWAAVVQHPGSMWWWALNRSNPF